MASTPRKRDLDFILNRNSDHHSPSIGDEENRMACIQPETWDPSPTDGMQGDGVYNQQTATASRGPDPQKHRSSRVKISTRRPEMSNEQGRRRSRTLSAEVVNGVEDTPAQSPHRARAASPVNIDNELMATPDARFEHRRRTRTPIPTDLEPRLQSLLRLIIEAPFYKNDSLEPTIGCEEGTKLLAKSNLQGIGSNPKLISKSIYRLFVNEEKRQCLLCGAIKTTHGRALSCVRSNLDHRPFHCIGIDGGCGRCGDNNGYVDNPRVHLLGLIIPMTKTCALLF